jgi:signal transduction histidine kinase/PAS domain-containing protein
LEKSTHISSSFLIGGGESGELTRQYNWQDSMLGTPDQWPWGLLVSVSNLLRTNLPMLVLWGPDHICFYNDAFIPSLGVEMHPSIGRRASEVWAEGWDFIGPLLKSVLGTGEAVSFQDAPVIFYRNGKTEVVYWTFSYSLILNDQGLPGGILVNCLETTEQVKAQQALKESQAELERIIDLAELGSYCIQLPANTISKSPRVAEWYGLPELTDVPASISAIDINDRERIRQVFTDALAAGSDGSYRVEYAVISALTGQKRILRTNGQVVCSSSGIPSRIDGSVMDITSQHESKIALEQQVQLRTKELASLNEQLAAQNSGYLLVNAKLEETNKLLTQSNESLQQFAYVASHDLQEPLRKIQQFSDLIKRQYADQIGDGVAHIERMQAASQRMSSLINDLLAYSQVSIQERILKPVTLDDVITAILQDFDLLIRETGAEVHVAPLPIVKGNALQLGQLFQNLLSNALKFRKPSVPTVINIAAKRVRDADLPASVHPNQPSAVYHCIEVSDNGVGFDEQYKKRIFQVFQRLHGRSEYPGTGIGLAICEKVATNHGGDITANSIPGQGTTFSVYLPATA